MTSLYQDKLTPKGLHEFFSELQIISSPDAQSVVIAVPVEVLSALVKQLKETANAP